MTPTPTTTEYAQPSETIIDNIQQRLAQGPAGLVERVNAALRRESIEYVGTFLWKLGCPFTSAELYEYRKILFPPNSMLDPYTAGAPTVHASATGLSANPEPQTPNPEPPLPTNSTNLTKVTNVTNATNATHSTPATPPASLLNDLRDLLNRYVVLPEMAAEALALWVVHTYAFTLRQVTTYIGVVSPEKRCGKTTLLELLAQLANRSLTASNISPSAMFRAIEEVQPTLLIDEADAFLEGRDELAGILNAGYRKDNSYVVRVANRGKPRRNPPTPNTLGGTSYTSPTSNTSPTPDTLGGTSYTSPTSNTPPTSDPPHLTHSTDSTQLTLPSHPSINPPIHQSGLVRFSCWCPKVMAAIGRLPDTLADRCILITMQRKMPGEKCERMRHLNAAEYRLRCAEFVRNHAEKIANAQPEIPSALNDRAADIWEPLLAIADLAGGDWPQLARAGAQKLSTHDDDLTPTGYFLKDLRNLMVLTEVDRMLCRDIVKRMNPRHDRPWEDIRRGREINEWWLGRLLSALGIRSRTTRAGDATGKGYTLADIDAAFRRYVPNPDQHTAILFSPSSSSSIPGSAASETSNPGMDAQSCSN